ncbi:MAG: N-acetyl-gamma-glutamyl-phosphate reductase [Flavobacteriales bacterium]|jgi:N-acetyl-gamma-glutamyl-phosphate reductase|uniref:N-acetyl-gamma-glutamyl-phosphate reductase n=1 Tax=Blattabacterium sp. (Mastotermes darwiniensis) TaxID=39768 RepID=UPI000231DE2E|nr:N-acetyl-gamma-glutamyl-phosphate reductase [Blattabacterium sp. (Mastotermes darwiniensis)]AER40610.1 N-acetyl-gamma-glutamyl-phosphate reductase [Blattabacterium sp. (Mastotermes darwiniensis) str. MADAR]MDR1805107.1 N-acetyl-gamma-glutamyl-phosphate reductase [Flavobacteriales bacterium]
MIEIGIIGGTGYTAGELIRLMIHHPKVRINSVVSRSEPGKLIHFIHQDLLGEIGDMKFTDSLRKEIDIVFLCSGHGQSRKELKKISKYIKVIDLSKDFRMINQSFFKERNFIYGLPELQKELIKKSDSVANPGCFSTAILLAILPLAKEKLLKNNIHISAITGSTGSGKRNIYTNNFSWRNNNISAYKIFQHQHLKEIKQTIRQVQNNFYSEIYFIPYRGNLSRGIIATLYTSSSFSLEKNKDIYKEYYKDHPFVEISDTNVDVKQVINTNKCILYLIKEKDQLIVISVIDNLIKGASGQAIQNMNLLFNLDETCGLKLKSVRF